MTSYTEIGDVIREDRRLTRAHTGDVKRVMIRTLNLATRMLYDT